MIRRLEAFEFHRFMTSGRTGPILASCEGDDGAVFDVVLKFSGACDEGVTSLAMELIAAQVAADVGVPVPEPFVVECPQTWVTALPASRPREAVERSSPVAFGSRLATGGYTVWSPGYRIMDATLDEALALFVFDAFIQNPDRQVENPNCLARGDRLLAIDHEAALRPKLIIGWRPPWLLGSLSPYERPGFHILRQGLRGRVLDFEPVRQAWAALSDDRLMTYVESVPPEWSAASAAVGDAIALIRDIRGRIEDCLAEVRRVLA